LLAFNYPHIVATDSPATVLEWVEKISPELVITDVCLPNTIGFQLLRRIRDISVNTRVLLLTGYTDIVYLREGIRLGLNGYVVKQHAATELNTAAHCVLRGQLYVSPSLYRRDLNSSCSGRISSSARHEDVLQLVRKNFSTREIAQILNVSTRTVAYHCHAAN
jgi:DNA-binding NarL/FixJ family response regulator